MSKKKVVIDGPRLASIAVSVAHERLQRAEKREEERIKGRIEQLLAQLASLESSLEHARGNVERYETLVAALHIRIDKIRSGDASALDDPKSDNQKTGNDVGFRLLDVSEFTAPPWVLPRHLRNF